jgi:hypothetical protein
MTAIDHRYWRACGKRHRKGQAAAETCLATCWMPRSLVSGAMYTFDARIKKATVAAEPTPLPWGKRLIGDHKLEGWLGFRPQQRTLQRLCQRYLVHSFRSGR